MKRRRQPVSQPAANINITSLLDITFVLMIAFMVVAPALKHGVDLELPEVKEAPSLKNDKPIAVTVEYVSDASANILVDGKSVSLEELVARLKAENAGGEGGRAVTLEGDRRVDWQTMTEVITELRQGGIVNIGILTNIRKSV